MLKSVSAFSIFLPSEREGGKKSYELFTRKVTLRGHGKEPAVSLLLLLPPMSLLYPLHSASPLVTLAMFKLSLLFWDRT